MARGTRRAFHRLVLILAVFTALPLGAEEGGLPSTVQLFVPTNRANPAPGRQDALRIEFADVDLEKVGDVIRRVSPILPEFSEKHPPVVPFYLSRQRSFEERLRMLEQAREQLRKAFPGIEPRIEVRYLEDEKVDVEAVSRRVGEYIEQVGRELPQDETTRKGLEALREANRKALEETLRQRTLKPSVSGRLVRAASWAKALLSFVSRGVQVGSAGFQGGAPLLSGLALVGADSATAYFATRFENEVGRAFADHPVPGSEHNPFLKRLNELYQAHPAKVVKGTLGTTALYGVAQPALMQQLGHWNNPQAISAVTGSDLLMMAGANLTSSFLYFGGFQGFESLRQKGWVSQPAVDILLRSTSFLWQLSGIAFSLGEAGRPILPFLLGPMWLSYGGAMLAGAVLPARNDRVVLVDSALAGHRGELNALEALESTLAAKATAEGVERAVREAETARERRAPLSRFWSAANPCHWWSRLRPRQKYRPPPFVKSFSGKSDERLQE